MCSIMLSFVLIGLGIFVVSAERVAVVQIFRHGHRTPVTFYPTDPYKNSDVWNGKSLGELTNVGKIQHYELGNFTKNRYSLFMPNKYHSSHFRIETTDVDRTDMSAQVNVYSMFPATGDDIWLPSINWHPIPIRSCDESIWSSMYYPVSCDIFFQLLADVLSSEEYQELNKKYESTYKILSKNSGKEVTDVVGAMDIWDSLKSEDTIGLTLPDWTKEVYPEPLRTLVGYAFASSTFTTQMKRFFIGPFLNEIVKYFNSMAENPTSSQRFKLYSGHDTNIAAVLNTLRAFNPPYPPAFASSIYFELEKEGKEYYVKVFSKDGDDFKQISVNGCQLNCSLSDFKSKLEDVLTDVPSRDRECSQRAFLSPQPTAQISTLVSNLRERLRNFST
ncbi:prostatic acid phosphatase-like [Diorhabda carinulata]|uniref:prostatic acid phosphatase-like n=1 Tax=Diorhabda carinulata TaxID=1163345 RepID=UPI0025A232AD|nr:prostatic acid phosphatase-like [Diorhabda carinulata]